MQDKRKETIRKKLNRFSYLLIAIILLSYNFVYKKHIADLPFTYYNDEAHMLNPALKIASNPLANPINLPGVNSGSRLILSYCQGYKYFLAYLYIAILPVVHQINESVNFDNIYNYPLYFIYISRVFNFIFLLIIGIFLVKISGLIFNNLYISIILLLLFFGQQKIPLMAAVAKSEIAATALITISFYYFIKFYLTKKNLHYFLLLLFSCLACFFKLTTLSAVLTFSAFSTFSFFTLKNEKTKFPRTAQFIIIISIILLILFIFVPHFFLNLDNVVTSLKSGNAMFAEKVSNVSRYALYKVSSININNFCHKIFLPALAIYVFLFIKNRNRLIYISAMPVIFILHLLILKNGLYSAVCSHYIIPVFPFLLIFSLFTYNELLIYLQKIITNKILFKKIQTISCILLLIISAFIFYDNTRSAKNIIYNELTNFYYKNQNNIFYISTNIPIGSYVMKFRKNTPPANPYLFIYDIAGYPKDIVKKANDKNYVYSLIIDPLNKLTNNKDSYFLNTYKKAENTNYKLDGYYVPLKNDKIKFLFNPYALSAKNWELKNYNGIWVPYYPITLPISFRGWSIKWETLLKKNPPSENNSYMTYIPLTRLKNIGDKIILSINKTDITDNIDLKIIFQNSSGIYLEEKNIEKFPYVKKINLEHNTLAIANALVIIKSEKVIKKNLTELIQITLD